MFEQQNKKTKRLGQIWLGMIPVAGLIVTIVIALDLMQRAGTWFWQETTCTIESSEVSEWREYDTFAFEVTYNYQFDAQTYQGDIYRLGYQGSPNISDGYRLAARYPVGAETSCLVNPKQPERATLRRASLSSGIFLIPSLLVTILGAVAYRSQYGRNSPATPEARIRKPFPMRAMLAFLFGGFLLIGLVFFAKSFVHPSLQVLAARSWQPVSCEVESSNVRTHHETRSDTSSDGRTYSINVLYNYELGGQTYQGNRYHFLDGRSSNRSAKAEIVASVPAGSVATCHVNPDDPFDVVINRSFTTAYLAGLIPLIFVLIGAVGLYLMRIWGANKKSPVGR
jgi:hypothetical protein